MSWHLLEKVLESVSKQATLIGKLWITLLFLLRIISLTRMAENLYSDEQGAFKCNTRQPGCENMCFNRFSPISHVRFWGFQMIITVTPSIIFILYAANVVSRLPIPRKLKKKNLKDRRKKLKDFQRRSQHLFVTPLREYKSHANFDKDEKDKRETAYDTTTFTVEYPTLDCDLQGTRSVSYCNNPNEDHEQSSCERENSQTESYIDLGRQRRNLSTKSDSNISPKRKSNPLLSVVDETEVVLAKAYKIHCIARSVLETMFLILQSIAFGFKVPEHYKCFVYPCPETVDCFISRPGEKSSMLLYMFSVTCVCIILSILEGCTVSGNISLKGIAKKYFGYNLCCCKSVEAYKPDENIEDEESGGKKDKDWYFLENLLDVSVTTETSASSSSDDSEDSVDSAELDEMYEQECDMEAQDYDGGNDDGP